MQKNPRANAKGVKQLWLGEKLLTMRKEFRLRVLDESRIWKEIVAQDGTGKANTKGKEKMVMIVESSDDEPEIIGETVKLKPQAAHGIALKPECTVAGSGLKDTAGLAEAPQRRARRSRR